MGPNEEDEEPEIVPDEPLGEDTDEEEPALSRRTAGSAEGEVDPDEQSR